MRIAIYLGDLSPPSGGAFTFQDDVFRVLMEGDGARRHSLVIYSNLSREQTARYDRADLLWERTRGELPHRLRRWMSACSEFLPFIASSVHYRGSFERSLRRHRVELVWFLTPTFHTIEVPYVYTIWDLQHRVQPWFPEVASYGRWHCRERSFARAVSRAAAVIVPNAAGREELERFYHVLPDRIHTFPLPTPFFSLEEPADRSEVLRKYGLSAGYLFYPAQFWPHKNHVNLLAALKLLKEEFGLVLPLVLAGADKGNRKYVRSLVSQWEMADQVHFLGFVPREDLVGLYRNALALTYPTFFGPENLPPLEAFGLGCPVIASRVRGADEQLGDAALLVDPTDVEGLAGAVWSLYQDQGLRKQLICRGRQRAARWTAEHFVQKVLAFIDGLGRVRRCWPTVV